MDNRDCGGGFYSAARRLSHVNSQSALAYNMPKKLIYGAIIIGIGLLVWFQYGDRFLTPKAGDKTWVEIDPIQCGGNPWEIFYSEKGVAFDASTQLSVKPKPVERLDKSEDLIIKDYYRAKGVEIFEVRSKKTHEIVCESCSCPRGDTLYLFVGDSDLEKILALGYKISKIEAVPKVE